MAQTPDFIIDNGTGAEVRNDINTALMALATTNTGATPPQNPVFGMLWVDTTSASLKIYAGNNWLIIIDSVSATTTSGASASFASGTKMIFNQVEIPSGWTQDTVNDRALRVISGTPGGTGGDVGFGDWLSGHSHVKGFSTEYPTGYVTLQEWGSGATGVVMQAVPNGIPAVEPKYVDVMICTKD